MSGRDLNMTESDTRIKLTRLHSGRRWLWQSSTGPIYTMAIGKCYAEFLSVWDLASRSYTTKRLPLYGSLIHLVLFPRLHFVDNNCPASALHGNHIRAMHRLHERERIGNSTCREMQFILHWIHSDSPKSRNTFPPFDSIFSNS